MATVDEPQAADPERHRPPPPRAGANEEIRAPRLLVVASEISWRLLVCVAAAAVFVYVLTQISFVAFPLLIALLLSTLLVPPAGWLQRRGLPRAVATVVVFVGGIALLAGAIALIAQPVAEQFDELGEQVSSGADELGAVLADLPLGLSEREIQEQIDTIDDRIRENSESVTSGVVSGARQAGEFLAGLAIMLVVLFFFVKDGPRMWEWFRNLVPPRRRAAFDAMGERSWRVLTAYVHGVVVVALIDAVGIGLGLWALGIPLVLPLALLTFVLAFIPIIGAVTAGAAACLVALVAEGVGAALLVLALVIAVQQIESNVLYPWIVGRTVELHPVVVLLSVAVGGFLYGIVGAAIAVPIALLVLAAARVVREHAAHGEVAVGPTAGRDDPS